MKLFTSDTVWNRNFTLLSIATITGAAGNVISSFALSFLVFEKTNSTFASALVLAAKMIPMFFLPLLCGPFFDRMKRKPVLMAGDMLNGILYLAMGYYLVNWDFSYSGYLMFSLLLACAGSFDELAYDSILPMTITPNKEQQSYSIAGSIYPFLNVVMMPLAAVLIQYIQIGWILIAQGFLSLLAAFIEKQMKLEKDQPSRSVSFSFHTWIEDLQEGWHYLKNEKGILSFQIYSAVANGIGSSCYPILVAFFSVTPGFTPLMFSWFSVMECAGRMVGSFVTYKFPIKKEKKYGLSLFVFISFQLMDAILLVILYPFMLLNRMFCGFLGNMSYTLRQSAVQSYIPEHLRARINSFQSLLLYSMNGIFSLFIGLLGEYMSYPLVMAAGAFMEFIVLYLTWIRHKNACENVFLQ